MNCDCSNSFNMRVKREDSTGVNDLTYSFF